MDNLPTPMEMSTKASGVKVKSMVKANSRKLMATLMLATGLWVLDMVKERRYVLMEVLMKVDLSQI